MPEYTKYICVKSKKVSFTWHYEIKILFLSFCFVALQHLYNKSSYMLY